MCGVIGLVYENHHPQLGLIAAELLKTLEYRGYDSTGAAIQGHGTDVRLAKGVGAPSVMVHELGIVGMAGQLLCGQVRWATFGAVTELNSQPHVVRCHAYLYGAHNGNVTNCDDLKRWLISEGHAVVSDNDGEMVVHTVEHHFAKVLLAQPPERREEPVVRRAAMREALCAAAVRLQGSYAAVIVDPLTRCAWAVKQGSSLYAGFGVDAAPQGDSRDSRDSRIGIGGGGGRFVIASSDLSSILKLTRVLIPLSEGEFLEFSADGYQVYSLRDRRAKTPEGERHFRAGEPVPRVPVRSRLRSKDTALLPGFSTFMDQEISAQAGTLRNLITLFSGGSAAARVLGPFVASLPDADRADIDDTLDGLRDLYDDAQIRPRFHGLCDLPAFRRLLSRIPEDLHKRGTAGSMGEVADKLASTEAGFLADLLPMARDLDDRLAVRLLDVLLEQAEVADFGAAVDAFTTLCEAAIARGGRIFVVCCGSSYHAALAGALFFNEIARAPLLPVLPGAFRGQYARSLRDGDVLVAVSQSGETKDLIDVINQVIETGLDIARVALVNNLNSTLAQEKCELTLPLRCGPEIAVPATKSFMAQVAMFYCLALRLGQRRAEAAGKAGQEPAWAEAVADRAARLPNLPALLRETITSTEGEVEQAAQLLYLCPSAHLLAIRLTAVALEGALKIREVVLNHTEGFEGSEFKHGPNTILGVNTLFGPAQVEALLRRLGAIAAQLAEEALAAGMPAAAAGRLVRAVSDAVFAPRSFALSADEQAMLDRALPRDEVLGLLYADYPLLYITGPDEQDVNLAVSQINTHKIRGASTVIVAEEHPSLRQAAAKAPADNPGYRHVYITLPRTGDSMQTVFSATVVLQRLALKMSLLKMHYLDRLGLPGHGVHPDVPKNVSKSITVD